MEEIRIGVYVCWCGTNIAKMVDVEKVVQEVAKMKGVVVAKDYKYMCSDPGQDLIIKDIKEHKLNRVVVSACSPRIHELTFRKALENAGLNPYLFQMANIREQVSWVHEDRERATQKAISLVTGAVNRVRWHEELSKRTVLVNPATMVVGGGVAGLSAALEIARAGRMVYLIEKDKGLGGMMKRIETTFPNFDKSAELLSPMVEEVLSHPLIQVYLNSEVQEVFGYVGNFKAIIKQKQSENEIEFGNVIVATGLKAFNPESVQEYGYGRLPNVITSLEFEDMLREGHVRMRNRKAPKSVAIIHCVGSRNEKYHPYCSRTCCMTALKYANRIKDILPDATVYDLYADMRAMGKGNEEFYAQTAKRKVMFMMFDQKNQLPYIRKADAKDKASLIIEMNELLSGEQVEVPVDLVILMVGVEGQENSKALGHKVGISVCGNEFYIEKHPKLDPVATTTDGVFVAGNCQAPKDIPEAIFQAKAASARVLGLINLGSVEVEVTTAHVNEDVCCGCQTCVKVCPYTAIEYLEDKGVSHVNEVLCKGCGTCSSACPTGAIRSRHFTEEQILSQIEGIMKEQIEI